MWYKPVDVYPLVGTVLVTLVCNMPRNEALATPASADGALGGA